MTGRVVSDVSAGAVDTKLEPLPKGHPCMRREPRASSDFVHPLVSQTHKTMIKRIKDNMATKSGERFTHRSGFATFLKHIIMCKPLVLLISTVFIAATGASAAGVRRAGSPKPPPPRPSPSRSPSRQPIRPEVENGTEEVDDGVRLPPRSPAHPTSAQGACNSSASVVGV